MTWGIDIAGYQAGLDYKTARDQGMQFCIVKASGYNTGSLYVADGYRAHLDGLTAIGGVALGHYYVPGRITSGKSVVQQADWYVDNLYKFDKAYAVVALDNEPLDSNATYWNQDDCLAWFQRVHERTGVPYDHMWLYCPAALTRQWGPWNKITDLPIKIWWSAYGGYPTGKTPDHEPSLQGKIARWDIHQYSSVVPIANKKTIDANYSNHTMDTLFGGTTTVVTLMDKARQYAAFYPKPSTGEPSWDQMCGNLMFRFGAFTTPGWNPTVTGPNAWNVGMASGAKNTNPAAAPPGSIHWWKNNNSTGYPGHVGVDLTGGGNDVFMATYAVRESLGAAIGIQSVGGYSSQKPFMLYQGWTNNYAGARFNTSGTAGGGVTPIDNNTGDIMARYLWAPNRGGILITETEGVFFPATTDANLAEEMRILQKKLFNGIDVTTREWDVARQDAIDRMITVDKNDAASLKAAGVGGGTVDNAAIIAAINKAIDDALKDVTIDPGDVVIDVDEIARRTRAEFASNPLK